jgi:hypothetical protein
LGERLAREYTLAAADMLAFHLRESGLDARAAGDQASIGVGSVAVQFRVDSIESRDNTMQVVFWATIKGVKDMAGSPIVLDLLGLGDDAHDALGNGVHALLDGVIPAIRRDHDSTFEAVGLTVAPVTSVTGRDKPRSWDLILGPPAFGGEPRDQIDQALGNLVLFQGIMDSVVDVLSSRVGHWLKLFLVYAPDGTVTGDVKVDGVQIGVAPSFATADWRGVEGAVIRQFGLLRPVERPIDAAVATDLESRHGSEPRRSGWLRRLVHARPSRTRARPGQVSTASCDLQQRC